MPERTASVPQEIVQKVRQFEQIVGERNRLAGFMGVDLSYFDSPINAASSELEMLGYGEEAENILYPHRFTWADGRRVRRDSGSRITNHGGEMPLESSLQSKLF